MAVGSRYRVALVGGGSISRLHAQALQFSTHAELVTVVGGEGSKLRAEEFAVAHSPDLATAALLHGANVAIICTPTATHAKFGIEAAKLGLHVLVEKAIDITESAALALIETCADQGVQLGVVSQGQFEPAFETLLAEVDAGSFGPLTLGSASRKCWRDAEYYRGWHGTKSMEGGGALITQAIHKIDQLSRLMGPATKVTGWTRTQAHRIDVEDTAVALVEFRNGAVGTIEATTAFYSAGATPPEQTSVDTLHISGTVGSAVLDRGVLTSTASLDHATNVVREATMSARLELFMRQHDDFFDALESGRSPRVTGEAGLQALQLVLAIYRSASTGTPVDMG